MSRLETERAKTLKEIEAEMRKKYPDLPEYMYTGSEAWGRMYRVKQLMAYADRGDETKERRFDCTGSLKSLT